MKELELRSQIASLTQGIKHDIRITGDLDFVESVGKDNKGRIVFQLKPCYEQKMKMLCYDSTKPEYNYSSITIPEDCPIKLSAYCIKQEFTHTTFGQALGLSAKLPIRAGTKVVITQIPKTELEKITSAENLISYLNSTMNIEGSGIEIASTGICKRKVNIEKQKLTLYFNKDAAIIPRFPFIVWGPEELTDFLSNKQERLIIKPGQAIVLKIYQNIYSMDHTQPQKSDYKP